MDCGYMENERHDSETHVRVCFGGTSVEIQGRGES